MKKKLTKRDEDWNGPIDTEVNETTNSTNPDVKFVVESIAPLDQEFGRADLNALRDKLNELILKGNK